MTPTGFKAWRYGKMQRGKISAALLCLFRDVAKFVPQCCIVSLIIAVCRPMETPPFPPRSRGGLWTMDGGRRTMDGGRRTMDGGRWTEDGGRWVASVGMRREAIIKRPPVLSPRPKPPSRKKGEGGCPIAGCCCSDSTRRKNQAGGDPIAARACRRICLGLPAAVLKRAVNVDVRSQCPFISAFWRIISLFGRGRHIDNSQCFSQRS